MAKCNPVFIVTLPSEKVRDKAGGRGGEGRWGKGRAWRESVSVGSYSRNTELYLTSRFSPDFVRSVYSQCVFTGLQLNRKHKLSRSVDLDLVDYSMWRRASILRQRSVWIPSWFPPGSWLLFLVSENSSIRMINAVVTSQIIRATKASRSQICLVLQARSFCYPSVLDIAMSYDF